MYMCLFLHRFSSVVRRLNVVFSLKMSTGEQVQKKRKWTKTISPVQCAGGCFVNLEKLNPSSRQSTKPWCWGEISKLIYSCHAKSLWTHEVHCFNLLLINFWWGHEKLFGMENTFLRVHCSCGAFHILKFSVLIVVCWEPWVE